MMRYFRNETAEFAKLYAQYSSDFISAEIQGLDPNDPNKAGKYMIRMADAVSLIKIPGSKNDDIKVVMINDPSVNYIPPGTKIRAMGSPWIVVNPNNLSGAFASAIVRKCNAVWEHLDYYGNLLSEPIAVVSGRLAKANESSAQNGIMVPKGYFNLMCQANSETANINTNSRIILGGAAYKVTGYSNFVQDITGDYGSVGLLEFTVRYEEINTEIDDAEAHIAGGRNFSWHVVISGMPAMTAGKTQILEACSVRNGDVIKNTERHPVNYIWTSSDMHVAAVDQSGNVTAVSKGECTITAALMQNPEYKTEFVLKVLSENVKDQAEVAFLNTSPVRLSPFESTVISAAYFENGKKTDRLLTWDFGGASEDACSIHTEGNNVTIRCFGGSERPLSITASCGQYSAGIDIELEGI